MKKEIKEKLVRVEMHLTKKEADKLDDIAIASERSRKNFCETEIRKVIKKLWPVLVCVVLLFGCKKKETEYAIRFEVNGKSSYVYQVGGVNKSGSTLSSVTLTEIAHDGDYIHCVATADSAKNVKLNYYRDSRLIVGQNANVSEVKEQL